MPAFSKPQSKSSFDKLPAELATRILDLAFLGRSRDVARCRLACQALHTLTSPYLIRTVVVAERLDALNKLREVLLHPYFSRHVTHLVWDASYYERGIAGEYSNYQLEFEQAEHVGISRDETYIKTHESDAVALRDLETHLHGHPLRDRSQDNVFAKPHFARSQLYDDCPFFRDGNHMKGCHIGFADYYRRWENQNKIQGRRKDRSMARDYFFEATKKLPNLRHLIYGDYRALAYNGETYAQLCQRLFGHTVCPSVSHIDEKGTINGTLYLERFRSFLEDLSSSRAVWDSLSIGRHPFETNHCDSQRHPYRNSGRVNAILWHDVLERFFEKSETPFTLTIRSLRLPLLTGERGVATQLGGLSKLVTASLVELDLGDSAFQSRWPEFKNRPQRALGDPRPDPCFQELLLSPQFKTTIGNLRILSLRGFWLYTDGLQALLLDRAPGLRTLHLIDCYCTDNYPDFLAAMHQNIRPATKLSGVEIFGLRFGRRKGETTAHERAQEYREKLQARRALEYAWHQQEEPHQDLKELYLSDWPYERPELEIAILGDRPNAVLRRMYAVPSDEARRKWQDLPSVNASYLPM